MFLLGSPAQPPCLTSFPEPRCRQSPRECQVGWRCWQLLSGTPAHLGFLSPSEGLALLRRCFVRRSGCLRSQKALGRFQSLFHANIYSCNCAGRMKTNPSSPIPLPPVFLSPQSPDEDRVQGHKAKSISPPPGPPLAQKIPTPTCAQVGEAGGNSGLPSSTELGESQEVLSGSRVESMKWMKFRQRILCMPFPDQSFLLSEISS